MYRSDKELRSREPRTRERGQRRDPMLLRDDSLLRRIPLIRPSATFSPQAGRRTSREIPRPAKRGEGAAKRQVRGRVITAPSAHCAVRGLRMTWGARNKRVGGTENTGGTDLVAA